MQQIVLVQSKPEHHVRWKKLHLETCAAPWIFSSTSTHQFWTQSFYFQKWSLIYRECGEPNAVLEYGIVHFQCPVLFCWIVQLQIQYLYDDISVHSQSINSVYQQKSSTKQSLHNNQNLGHTMYKKLFQIQWTNKAKQFREHWQHFISHSFKALRTLLTKHPAKRNYKEPTRLETNSKNILSKTKTVNPETKFQHKMKMGNILYPEFGNELLNTWNESPKKSNGGWGFETILLRVWGLSFELRRGMEIRNKLFQKVSLNKIT